MKRLHQVGITPRDQLIHPLDDGDGRSKGMVNRGHLKTDDPAAHNQKATRDIGQFEGSGGINEPWIIMGKTWNFHRLRSHRDDGGVEANFF